eukprot:1529478-Amphidinium_carterae.1
MLLDNGHDINGCLADGRTPLHCAAVRGHVAITEILLAQESINVHATSDGVTPVHDAALHDRPAVLRRLLMDRR